MSKHFLVGVDGGASKCIVRVEDESGKLVGRETSGPANVRLSVEQTWCSINTALEKIFHDQGINMNSQLHLHGGMGLAGCEIPAAQQAFLKHNHQFETLIVSPDSHTACLGAHNGCDGAIIIIGTGVVGFQIEGSHTLKVGGWGFPNDDEGGGAWLGLEAIKLTLKWYDGRHPTSDLIEAVFRYFNEDIEHMVSWSNEATSTDFAKLAPLVIIQSERGDPVAIHLMQRAAAAIDNIADALHAAQTNPKTKLYCSLIGGVAPFLQSYLSPTLKQRLQVAKATPDQGAILLLQRHLAQVANG